MAKIYETQTDFEKDRLKDETNRSMQRGLWHLGLGNALTGLSLGTLFLHDRKPETRGWMKWASGGLLLAGGVEVIRSLFIANKVSDLKAQREKLGPETVILPPGVGEQKADDCGCHMKHAVGMQPKNFSDFAAKPTGAPTKG